MPGAFSVKFLVCTIATSPSFISSAKVVELSSVMMKSWPANIADASGDSACRDVTICEKTCLMAALSLKVIFSRMSFKKDKDALLLLSALGAFLGP